MLRIIAARSYMKNSCSAIVLDITKDRNSHLSSLTPILLAGVIHVPPLMTIYKNLDFFISTTYY